MNDRRTEIAKIIVDASYEQMIEIAESMMDYSESNDPIFAEGEAALNIADFLFLWAKAVTRPEEEV